MTGTRSRRSAGAIALAAALMTAMTWLAPMASASTVITVNTVNQEINGDGFCSLQEAIYAANLDDSIAPDSSNPGAFFDTACPAGSGADTIELPPMSVFSYADPIDDNDNFVGPSATPIITSQITIEGRGAKLQRLAAGRLTRAFVVGPTGYLDLREVHVKGFAIRGGNGNDGGGGGMGAGGAIYVQGGRLLVQWSTFEGNTVHGGNGAFQDQYAGGGGGGLSGDGGAGANDSTSGQGGGGGGGARGDGAGVVIVAPTDYNWGGGGGGRVTSAVTDAPTNVAAGEPCGADAQQSLVFPSDGAEDGHDANPFCAGGGGGGGTSREFISDPFCGGDGGDGSYGGGGGGGGNEGDGGHGGFGGGGGGNGGEGGFGGGGGSGNGCALTLGSDAGQGGTFAGDGDASGDGDGSGGGGGAGLGGAIFGYLATIDVINSTFAENSASWGRSGGGGANDGRGAGGAIFTVAGDLTVESSTIADNVAVTLTNGGGGGIVVYDPIGTDEATLLLRNTILAGNGVAECYTRNSVTTSGSQGNVITNSSGSSTPDATPCAGVASAVDPALAALALNAPGRTPTMAIGASSSAINATVGAVPLDDQRGVSRPQGLVADIGAYEYETPAAVPPVTTITLTPSTPNGSNGWYTTAVGVSVTASDFDDDVAQTRCGLDPAAAPASFDDLVNAACTLSSVPADGHHAIYAASVDVAGNTESPVVSATLKIDQTAPTLAPTLNVGTPITIGQAGVTASPNATDLTSGVASSSCGAVDTSTPGAQTVSCTATDNAGNTGTGSVTFVVEYRILGFFSPVPGSKWRAGQTVPIKIAIGGATERLSDAEASALAQACRVTFSATGAQSVTGQCLKYDAATDQFIFTWKLKKNQLGAATIMVSISYPGSAITTALSESIVIIR